MNTKKTVILFAIALVSSSFCVRAIPPPVMAPLAPAIHPEPKLLTPGQRAWVKQELHLLLDDLAAAWEVVDNDPALIPLKKEIDELSTNSVAESLEILKELNSEYGNARTVLFSQMEGMTNKQSRALLYGRMLQYDNKLQTNLRRRGLSPKAVDPEPQEEEPQEEEPQEEDGE